MMFKRFALTAMFAVLVFGLAQAADFSKIPNPMKNAKTGQSVTYTSMGGMEQKQSITAVEGSGDDLVVTVKTEVMMGGNAIQSDETKISLKDAKAQQEAAWQADPDVKISDAKVNVGGKDYNAVLIESTTQGITTKIYMSEEVPVSGILKMESSALPQPLMEVKEFSN